jgi:hypothetical protein
MKLNRNGEKNKIFTNKKKPKMLRFSKKRKKIPKTKKKKKKYIKSKQQQKKSTKQISFDKCCCEFLKSFSVNFFTNKK